MSELVLQEPTFALSSTDAIDLLLAEREQAVDSINAVAGVMADARASGGRMVAVIPSSAKGKALLPGCEYHDTFDFPGTSIQVVLMTAEKEQP